MKTSFFLKKDNMNQNYLRYIFAFLGIVAMVWLIFLDKIYPESNPISNNVLYIIALFIVWSFIGADNLTSIISLYFNKKKE